MRRLITEGSIDLVELSGERSGPRSSNLADLLCAFGGRVDCDSRYETVTERSIRPQVSHRPAVALD